MVIFRHKFDRQTGSYVSSEPLDFVQSRELLTSLDVLNRESMATLGTSFVIEAVTLEEVTVTDFRILLEYLDAINEQHRADAAIAAYVSERLAA